ARVAIVEGRDFVRFRVGETIAPSAKHLLPQLGIDGDQHGWLVPCAGIAAAWGGPERRQRPSILSPLGGGWRMDRCRFDHALFAQALKVGATGLMQHRLASAERSRTKWTFTLAGPHGVTKGRATWVIAATGRRARAPLAPSSARRWLDRLIGIA